MERGLTYFIHRAKVLKQYRQFQRVISRLRRSPEIGVSHEVCVCVLVLETKRQSSSVYTKPSFQPVHCPHSLWVVLHNESAHSGMSACILSLPMPACVPTVTTCVSTNKRPQEIAERVRSGYERHRDEPDMQRARFFLQQGELELKTVLALVATTGPSGFEPFNMHNNTDNNNKGTEIRRNQYGEEQQTQGQDQDQEQGRLGVEWPWER